MSTTASGLERKIRRQAVELCIKEQCSGMDVCSCDSPEYQVEVSVHGFLSSSQGFHEVALTEDERKQATLTITSTPEGIVQAARLFNTRSELSEQFFHGLIHKSTEVDLDTQALICEIIMECRPDLMPLMTTAVA